MYILKLIFLQYIFLLLSSSFISLNFKLATILNLVRKRSLKILKQELGPFQPQSATYKNLAVSWLMVPGALESVKHMKGGLKALCKYLRHSSIEVDKDVQLKHVEGLIDRVSGILQKEHQFTSKMLKKLGWEGVGMVRKK